MLTSPILGGGHTGLWTAYYLLRANRRIKVAVIEKEIVGFGASGRNGGWCSSKFPVTAGMLEQRYGLNCARTLMLAMNATVEEVARVCDAEDIDAHFHKGGILTLARGDHQLPAIQSAFEAYSRLGLQVHDQLLTAAEAQQQVRVTNVRGALYARENASIHPGRLVRGRPDIRKANRTDGTASDPKTIPFLGAGTAALACGALHAKRISSHGCCGENGVSKPEDSALAEYLGRH